MEKKHKEKARKSKQWECVRLLGKEYGKEEK